MGGDAKNDKFGINEIEHVRKQYVFDSIDRKKELKQKQNEMKAQINDSWHHNSTLTGHASKVYASLQKMMELEKERKIKKNKNMQNEAVHEIKNKFIEEANS